MTRGTDRASGSHYYSIYYSSSVPSDLASIPSFLGWFARRHGRHTPAALMHDELITDKPEELPQDLRMKREEADLLFRQALRASQVPLVMSWVLWTG